MKTKTTFQCRAKAKSNIAAVLNAALFCGVLAATTSGPAAADSSEEGAAPQSSMRVFIDPETGERRVPDPQERAQTFSKKTSPSAEPEVIERDGMRIMHMPASSRMQLRGQVGASGKVSTHHGQGDSHE